MPRVLSPKHDARLQVSALARTYSTSSVDTTFTTDLMHPLCPALDHLHDLWFG